MKKFITLSLLAFSCITGVNAQFGFAKKADIETFKDSRLVVILYNDSAYNASIRTAVSTYWNFTGGYEFVHDSMTKAYSKGNFSFLSFAKGKKSNKIKAKLGSSEDDCNGLVVTKKYRKRAKFDEILAEGFCSNVIDTADWHPELVRAVQMINNYFNFAIQEEDKNITFQHMVSNYPGDLSILSSKKMLVELGSLQMKGKEDASVIYDNEVEEVDRDEIYKAVLTQDPGIIYVFTMMNEKDLFKIFVSAANSEVMHVEQTSPEKSKIVAKDLKTLKQRIDKANK